MTHAQIHELRVTSSSVTYVDESRPAQPKRLRVLHVITSLGRGGTENVVLKLVSGFGEDLFEQKICTTRGYDPEFARVYDLGAKLYLTGRRTNTFQFPLFRLAWVMRQYRPDIVHTRNWGALEAVPAARLAGVPRVIHSEHGYEMENLSGLPLRHRLFRRAAYAMADLVFTVTEELRNYHAQQAWLPSDRIRVIYNGVDTARFAPRPEIRARVRQSFGWGADSVVVGTIGRLTPIKNQVTLLLAAERVIRSGIDAHVLVVGDGVEMEAIRRRAEESPLLSGRTHLVGASEQVPELLNAMDVFVLPSLKEGMSNTLLEAMASGLPVVATRVGGNPEIVEDTNSGWLFAPMDIADLADRLTRLTSDPGLRRVLGCAARQRVVTHFDLKQMFENYRKMYVEIHGVRRPIAKGEV